uniref:GOLD domain-containing protein n=1 Tax=Pelusios castaneus TaxID=367368 RepID=A0A8C8RI81_9SAUR
DQGVGTKLSQLGHTKIMKNFLIGFLLTFFVAVSPTLYFHSGEREEKCIIEDIPSDTLITGNYKVQQWDTQEQVFLESAPGLGMFVTITTSLLLSKLYGPQGTFSFTSHLPGEHIICLQSNSTRLVSFGGSKLRIYLDIRVGEHFLDETIAQAKDKVNEVNSSLGHLIEQIHHISKEQNYHREREEYFRLTSEETNSNILWWATAQTLILILVGVWQIKCLKDFFIAKKLV